MLFLLGIDVIKMDDNDDYMTLMNIHGKISWINVYLSLFPTLEQYEKLIKEKSELLSKRDEILNEK